jgi:hypothetical protein
MNNTANREERTRKKWYTGEGCDHGQKKWVCIRKQVQAMYFDQHIPKSTIAQQKGVSKKFVIRWTTSPDQDCMIDVMHEKVFLPPSYINYFVLAEWNLTEEKLSIYFDKEQVPFTINKRSKKRRKGW